MYKIYGIVNSRTSKIFYVGQTMQALALRLIQTRYEWRNSKGGRKKHRAISRVYARGGELVMVELDRCDSQKEADRLERQHIKYLRTKRYKLANTSEGGAGNWGVKRSAVDRRRISAGVTAYHRQHQKL